MVRKLNDGLGIPAEVLLQEQRKRAVDDPPARLPPAVAKLPVDVFKEKSLFGGIGLGNSVEILPMRSKKQSHYGKSSSVSEPIRMRFSRLIGNRYGGNKPTTTSPYLLGGLGFCGSRQKNGSKTNSTPPTLLMHLCEHWRASVELKTVRASLSKNLKRTASLSSSNLICRGRTWTVHR